MGSTSPPFLAPISHYLISSLQDALYVFFAGRFCVLAWTAVFPPQCCQSLLAMCKIFCSSESLLVLQNAQGTLSGWHYCCLGFLEPALSHSGLLFIVHLFHSCVDELCFQPCLGTEGIGARNSFGQGRYRSGCLSTAPSLGQSLVEKVPACIHELSCFSCRGGGLPFFVGQCLVSLPAGLVWHCERWNLEELLQD